MYMKIVQRLRKGAYPCGGQGFQPPRNCHWHRTSDRVTPTSASNGVMIPLVLQAGLSALDYAEVHGQQVILSLLRMAVRGRLMAQKVRRNLRLRRMRDERKATFVQSMAAKGFNVKPEDVDSMMKPFKDTGSLGMQCWLGVVNCFGMFAVEITACNRCAQHHMIMCDFVRFAFIFMASVYDSTFLAVTFREWWLARP